MYKVLIADSEKNERIVLEKILKKYFWESCVCYQANTGLEAVDIFEKEQIQIVISDVTMPIMSGLEAAKLMRQMNEYCIIIFLTAYGEFSFAREAISIKALDYLLKPCKESELVCIVEEAMRQVERNKKVELLLSSLETTQEEEPGDVRLSFLRQSVEDYIKEHYTHDISVHDLAMEMNYSETYFCKLFKQCFKLNFTAYLAEYRMNEAKKLLANPRINIKDVGRSCGYSDSNYFTRVFKRTTGYTPTEYRNFVCAKKTK